jgi:predicted O-methyltransferase YrrM
VTQAQALSRDVVPAVRVVPHFLLWLAGLAPPQTQTSDAERDCLAKHAAGKRRLVEIGVWHGVTTARLRAAMAPDAVLYAVDPFPAGRARVSVQRVIAHRQVGNSTNGTVEWVRLTGGEAGRRHEAAGRTPVDFVFIDGDHAYDVAREDWEAWSPLVVPGGIVALHDSHPTMARPIHDAGSVRFTEEHVLGDPRFRVVEVVDTLTVLQRIVA